MGRHGGRIVLGAMAVALAACTAEMRGDSPFDSAGMGETSASAGPGGGGDDGTGGSETAGGGEVDGTDAEGDGGVLFDLPPGGASQEGGDAGLQDGCDKVDFLFVLDNSISMGDEQQNLSSSFPSFIATIQEDVVSDWHVLVIDTDGADKWDEELTECLTSDCVGEDPTEPCGVLAPEKNWACGNLPAEDACDATLGAGVDHDGSDARGSCGIAGGKRWFDDTEPDPPSTFGCVANLYDGNSPELTMEGMLAALDAPMVGPGGCNEGFLRDDAVLVVTFISDEEDMGDSMGDPASWRAELLAKKGGNETAVVMLGLLGDTGLPGAVCPPDSVPGSNGGEYSPRLIEMVESFGDRGVWGSVCAPDYGPFFEQAVALIDLACDEYVPEG
jgi:hypothetical protein